jgi:hypothetical protein
LLWLAARFCEKPGGPFRWNAATIEQCRLVSVPHAVVIAPSSARQIQMTYQRRLTRRPQNAIAFAVAQWQWCPVRTDRKLTNAQQRARNFRPCNRCFLPPKTANVIRHLSIALQRLAVACAHCSPLFSARESTSFSIVPPR